MIERTFGKAQLQLDIFDLFDRQCGASQPILQALDYVLKVKYVRLQRLKHELWGRPPVTILFDPL